MDLAIKMNDSIAPRACPLCGRVTNPNIGPELTLARNRLVICRDCGWIHVPALVALLELAQAAENFSSYLQEFGEKWHAELDAKLRRRVD